MWKEVFETKVIRVEGFDSPDLISCIYISDILSDELVPYNKDTPIELPMKVTCKIIIKSHDSNSSKSVSFNTKIIEEDGVQWLPLYEKFEEDLINSIPDEVISPRVLLLLQKKISLDVIKEGGEKSEIGSACEDEYMPEIKLCSSFYEGNTYNPFEESYEQPSQEVTEINGNRQLSYNINDELNQELKINLQRVSYLLEIEKKSRDNVIKDMENMKIRFLQELSEAKTRENEILEELKETENKLSASKFELIKLKTDNKSLQAENARLSQTIINNESFYLDRVEELNKKIQIYEETCIDSEKIVARLSDLTGISIETFSSSEKLQEKEEIIAKLKKENTELRVLNSSLQISKQNMNIDELEETVQRYSRKLNLAGQLIRDKEQTYVYGIKKLSILLKDEQLFCRVGGMFKPLDEYIHIFLSTDNISSHKLIKSTADIQKELEETNKLKSNPPRKNNKSLTSSSKTAKRGSNYL